MTTLEYDHSLMPVESIAGCILVTRGQKVIMDADLARLYGVSTKRLNEQVRRNKARFPADFVFQLTLAEKSELVANCDRFNRLKHSTVSPCAFTEHGAVMAASILNTPTAVEVSVYVVRAFVRLRELLSSHAELSHKLEELESRVEARLDAHDEQIGALIRAIRELMAPPENPQRRIGFRIRESRARYRVQHDKG